MNGYMLRIAKRMHRSGRRKEQMGNLAAWSTRLMLVALVCTGSAVLAGERQDNDDGEPVHREATGKPIRDALDIVKGIGGILGGRNRSRGATGATLQFEVLDWVGRPTNARILLVGNTTGHRYSEVTLAGRATIVVENSDSYRATLESRWGRPGPPREITVRHLNETMRIVLRLQRLTPEQMAGKGAFGKARREESRTVNSTVPHRVTRDPSGSFNASYGGDQPRGRNLQTGGRLALQGEVMDREGRPTNALVQVYLNNQPYGFAYTVTSRFSMFDLPAGVYIFEGISLGGMRSTKRPIEIGSRIPRIVLRINTQ